MSISDMKLYAINAGALSITTFTQIEDGLKIFLLLITYALKALLEGFYLNTLIFF